MSNTISPELQAKIEQEGKDRRAEFESLLMATVAENEYYIGAELYALKWEQAEQLIEQMAKALEEIQAWCKESGLKQVSIDSSIHMAVYNSMHKANQALTDYNTYKKGKDDK